MPLWQKWVVPPYYRQMQVDVQVPTQPLLTSNHWLPFFAGWKVGICFSKWSPLTMGGLFSAYNKKVQASYLPFPDTILVQCYSLLKVNTQASHSAFVDLGDGSITIFLWCLAIIKNYCLNIFFLLSFCFYSALVRENKLLLELFLLLREFEFLNSSGPCFG